MKKVDEYYVIYKDGERWRKVGIHPYETLDMALKYAADADLLPPELEVEVLHEEWYDGVPGHFLIREGL